ncbi:hypothetical protein CapIbe_012728 [Capra ibex]
MQDFNLEGQHGQSGILKIALRPQDGEQTGGSACVSSMSYKTWWQQDGSSCFRMAPSGSQAQQRRSCSSS